jgi:hypothetical protein
LIDAHHPTREITAAARLENVRYAIRDLACRHDLETVDHLHQRPTIGAEMHLPFGGTKADDKPKAQRISRPFCQ